MIGVIWKDADQLGRAVQKNKFIKKTGKVTSVDGSIAHVELTGYLFKRFDIEAKPGSELTTFLIPVDVDYPETVVCYKTSTRELEDYKVRGFVFGPLKPAGTGKEKGKPRTGRGVNDLFVLLFHLAKRKLDPLSKRLNKNPQVLKLCRELYKGWDPLKAAYGGVLFPVLGDPGTSDGYLLRVVSNDRLKSAKVVAELANYIASELGTLGRAVPGSGSGHEGQDTGGD
ncbi:MAG: hypothetical protein ACTSU5_03055 [Promethearchaeota archaeon]